MTMLEKLRIAIVLSTKERFAAADFSVIPSVSARLSYMVTRGELVVCDQVKPQGKKPYNVYRVADKIEMPKVENLKLLGPILEGQQRRTVRWHEATNTWCERTEPNREPMLACPSMIELLQLLNQKKGVRHEHRK